MKRRLVDAALLAAIAASVVAVAAIGHALYQEIRKYEGRAV